MEEEKKLHEQKRATVERGRIVGPMVGDAVFCKICKELMEDPMECSECNAGFCKACISLWMCDHKSCPNKCANCTIRRAHILVRNMLNSLQIKCQNFANGCTQVVAYEFLRKHEAECGYASAACKYSPNGCPFRALTKDMKAHEEECGYLLTKCKKGCDQNVLRKDFAGHSCVRTIKDMVLESRGKLQHLTEEEKRLECALARAQYKNLRVACNGCDEVEFPGVSYRCTVCEDFDLCLVCFKVKGHAHDMHRVEPLAFYTELLEQHMEKFGANKLRVDIVLSIRNYDHEKHVIRPKVIEMSVIEYLSNDFFEVAQLSDTKKVVSFLLPHQPQLESTYEFYIESLDCRRFFGLPFKVQVNQQ